MESHEGLQRFRHEFNTAISELDPLSEVQYAQRQFAVIIPNPELLSLYEAIRAFPDTAYGEGFRLEDNHMLVVIPTHAQKK